MDIRLVLTFAMIRNMNIQERIEFESTIESIRSEMKALHRQSIIMEHEAISDAANAILVISRYKRQSLRWLSLTKRNIKNIDKWK
jgi:hypothetical protein